jgi:thioredoxin-related protein
VAGPTQFYGYVARGEEAAPQQELAYIESVRQRYYAGLLDMPVPVSKANFDSYGASTTPTIVLLDRAGRVALYHPGAMPYEELRTAIEGLVRP